MHMLMLMRKLAKSCFMDIPSNVFIFNKDIDIENNKKIWKLFYKPEHLKVAPRCSKCNLYYWQIENKFLK